MIKEINKNFGPIVISATLGAILSHQLSNPGIIMLINQINYDVNPWGSTLLTWIGYFGIVAGFSVILFYVILWILLIFNKLGEVICSLFGKRNSKNKNS